MKSITYIVTVVAAGVLFLSAKNSNGIESLPYVIVDTGQVRCYDNWKAIRNPTSGNSFFGQDAQYIGVRAAYRDNGDGTVSDLNTRLMWQQDPGEKMTFAQAVAGAAKCRTGGYDDWRLPSIKALYSLMDFSGTDPDPRNADTSLARPFIDSDVFAFRYGDSSKRERIIDSQFATCTEYGSTTMGGNATMFGVNFADGRIKGYPSGVIRHGHQKTFHVLYVRGNPGYGKNQFEDNGDGTVTDRATGLTWTKADSGKGMNWADALAYAESLELAGHDDWRLPDAKELQSIVDYERCPDVTGSPAIDPVFATTAITNERGQKDYPSCWTGTTHVRVGGHASSAAYVAFGRAMGCMHGRWMDVHGAGCQRSDPKSGNPRRFPNGRGPQGDAIRILNYVRCVRGGNPS
jgi:hypothetical protein